MLRHYYFRLSSLITPYSIWIVAILHLAGIIGMLSPFGELFQLLTPFNLLLCAAILWINHRERHREVFWYSAIVFSMGFLVEYLGVRYGVIFGQYSYGRTLGIKLLNVPLIIGLNWLLVMYCIACLTDSLKISILSKIILGAVLAVSVDWLIEPVAMHFDFWSWNDGAVPLQNYVGWFFTSIIMQSIYHLLRVKAENKLALPYYFTQLFFFLVLNLAIR